jgi:energy-coupling factor transport system substrate-specific component
MIAILATSMIGIVAFGWPLIAAPDSTAVAHAGDAPWLFAIVIPMLLAVVLAQFTDRGMDAKAVALLGVLSAVVSAMRPLGGGTAGLEPIWVVLVLGGRALGPGFGFALGAVSLFSSALLTGGVGPWLPFQMLGAAWVGLGAGLLPQLRGKREIALLACYGAVAAFAYGLLLNLWFWPFTTGLPAAIAYIPGAPIVENVLAWLRFTTITSLGYDIPRAILTVTLIVLAGPTVLTALRRVSRKAAFDVTPTFVSDPIAAP